MTPTEAPGRPGLTATERHRLLTMSDEDLLRQCRVGVFFGTGRGGQKRNRTESAVRVTHGGTGVSVTCDETRSQHTNRMLALRKLRLQIALVCRCTPAAAWTGPWHPAAKSPGYAPWLAAVLDVLEEHACRVSEAAKHFGLSTGRLIKDLGADAALWQAVNASRQRHGHPPLRHP